MRFSWPRTAAIIALGLTGSLLLVGCSSGLPNSTQAGGAPASAAPSAAASPSGGSGAAAACSLITEQEASTALGSDPGPGVADTLGIATSCTFGTPPSILRVDLVPTDGKASYEHALGLAKAHPVVTISGVGDGAFGTFNGTVGSIEFYKGDAVVSILLAANGASTPSQDKLTVLAKQAAGRL